MMADVALTDGKDSINTKRACAWCGADISHRGSKAKFCDNRNNCAAAFYYKRDRQKIRVRQNARKRAIAGYPPLEGRECRNCGVRFDALHARQIYCVQSCREKASRRRGIDHHRKRVLDYAKKNRSRISTDERERRRRRAAEAAISMLILPIEEHRT